MLCYSVTNSLVSSDLVTTLVSNASALTCPAPTSDKHFYTTSPIVLGDFVIHPSTLIGSGFYSVTWGSRTCV